MLNLSGVGKPPAVVISTTAAPASTIIRLSHIKISEPSEPSHGPIASSSVMRLSAFVKTIQIDLSNDLVATGT